MADPIFHSETLPVDELRQPQILARSTGAELRLDVMLESDAVRSITDTHPDGHQRTYKVLKAGSVLGKITATGRYGPYCRTLANGGEPQGETQIAVDDATAFVVGQQLVVEPTGINETKTVTAIDYTNNVITVDSGIVAVGGLPDNAVIVANNGQESPGCVLAKDVNLTFGDAPAAAIFAFAAFNVGQLIWYAGNEAQVKAGLPNCEFLTVTFISS